MVQGDEIKWTVKGIDLCIQITRDVLREARQKEILRKPIISRWVSRELYYAIDQALRYLGRMDKAKAVRILEDARTYARRDNDNRMLRKTQRLPSRVG